MATVAELIRDTLEDLGVLAAGESATAADEAHAFRKLNRLLDSWAGERLALWATLRSTHTLTPSLNPHTIGTSGTFNTTRPVRIDRASITPAAAAGTEQPLDLFTDAQWQATQGKDATGTPAGLWVESAYPLMKLWLNPIPSAADTLVLYTWQQIGRFTATSDSVSWPPGYERAVIAALGKELAPSFGVSLSQEAIAIADEAKATLKRLNHQPSYLRCDPAVLGRGGSNLVSGDV